MKYGVLGHRGMVGSALMRALPDREVWTSLADLRDQKQTREASISLRNAQLDVLFLCAARVGGIQANIEHPVEFLRENLLISINVMEMVQDCVNLFVFLGSSCIYPRDCEQPMREEHLLSGPLEPSNEPYALAKIAGIKLCEAYKRQFKLPYLALMPCNLYGPNDNYDLESSHVLPAMIRRFHEAKISGASTVAMWGTGMSMREFMHVDDMAAAALHLVRGGATGLVNVGSGYEVSIRELALLVANVVGYDGRIEFDPTRPDGTPRKLLELSKMEHYGASKGRHLVEGIGHAYESFLEKK